MIRQAEPDHRRVDRGGERPANCQFGTHLGTYITKSPGNEVHSRSLVVSIPETNGDFVADEVFATGHEPSRGFGPRVEVGDAIDLDREVFGAVTDASADGRGQERVARMGQVLPDDTDVQGLTEAYGRSDIEGEGIDEGFALPIGVDEASGDGAVPFGVRVIEDAEAVLDHAEVTKTGP